MKKSAVHFQALMFGYAALILTSCSTSLYTGSFDHPEVSFDHSGFSYVTTIEGSSVVSYRGFSVRKVNGLMNEAKRKMYSQHDFRPNEVITNVTTDIIETGFFWRQFFLRELIVQLSADVYRFGGEGEQFEINKEKIEPSSESVTNPFEKYAEKSDAEEFSKIQKIRYLGFSEYDERTIEWGITERGILLLIEMGDKFYKGTFRRNLDGGRVRLQNIYEFDSESVSWKLSRQEIDLPKSVIVGFRYD
jgi:hypothetical protein